jgi:small subunit ribosomal protein S1
MSWSRATAPGAVVAPGDQITVKVLRVDEATGKISLGLKQLQDDPWSTAGTTYEVGQVRSGRVTRVAEFGAFVELEPGIEGLAHASTFPPTGRPRGWAESVPVGTTAAFEILSVDLAQKRIGVALVQEGRAVDVAVPEADASGRIRLSKKALAEQREQAELREYADREDAKSPTSLGSLADTLRAALKGR